MSESSPAAQAVLDAMHEIMLDISIAEFSIVAAALRAAALYCPVDRRILMTIADELENHP